MTDPTLSNSPIHTGLDVVLTALPQTWRESPVALLTNRAATTRHLLSAAEALLAAGVSLQALLAPEHGIRTSLPAGVSVPFTRDSLTGLPVYSLYGERRATSDLLSSFSRIIVDLPDVGARFFTYSSTLVQVMRVAAQINVPVTVLDRPNPITGTHVEGPIVEDSLRSFVGMVPVPVRHGLTLGEIARLARHHMGLDVDLEVIKMQGWRRGMWFDETGYPWVPPSPNMPHLETAVVYPGTCLVEGTNLSEGRGTPYPFQVVGAPWLDGDTLARTLNEAGLPGVRFRGVTFRPCESKHAGHICEGVQVHVTDRNTFRPVCTGVVIVIAARAQDPDRFRFLQGEEGVFTFDRLIGTPNVRLSIEEGRSWQEIGHSWEEEEAQFAEHKRQFHLYA